MTFDLGVYLKGYFVVYCVTATTVFSDGVNMKLTCSKCGGENNRLPQRYCAACHAEYMRKNRPPYKNLPDDQKKKSIARSIANVYQKRGLLTKQTCTACDSLDAEKHHEDYKNPLDVVWLCRKCHLSYHLTHMKHPSQASELHTQ